ncbi:MAG TPA: FkbM family methyltransferase [Thermoanaerobaculia bacterium]|nr:FkbM family methyltransferase [Thermoanaerobaculia bacterium]
MTDQSLKIVGADEATRARIIAALQQFELLPERRFTTVRDDVTGPIVDALHASLDVVRKELSNGLVFEFPYRSKIARDFVMSVPEKPDHVWEPQTTKLLLHLSAGASHVVIGGAYFGDQAIPVAHAMRGRGVCHAFEPNREMAAMLSRNAALNALDNVRVHPLALWSDDTSRLAFVGDDAYASTVACGAAAAPQDDGVPTTTIDSYAAASGIDRFDLIMLDLEGGELNVLRGAEGQLSRHAPHVVFEVHRSYVDWSHGLHNTDIARWLASFGYTLFAIRDFQSNYDLSGRPVELVPADTAYLEGPPHGLNLLAIKDTSIIENEHFEIVPNVSSKLLLHRDPKLHHPRGGL